MQVKRKEILIPSKGPQVSVSTSEQFLPNRNWMMYCICTHTHLHTHRYPYIHTLQKYNRVLYMMTADFENAPDMVLMMFYVSAFSFSEESKPVLCFKAFGGVFKKKMTQVYELFLPPQSPLLKLILSIPGCDFCSPTTLSVPVNELWKETSQSNRCFEEKAQPAEGALRGLRQAVTPSASPAGPQITLNKRRLHAGQRLWGHVTSHAAFQPPLS